MKLIFAIFLMFLGSLGFAQQKATDLKLNPLFGDNMVLQRGIKVPVWGNAAPGAEISVKMNGQEKKAKVDENGKWSIALDPMKEGGPFTLSVGDGKNTLERKNVMLGDVWFCSGQSNMEYQIKKFPGADKWSKDADYPQIRLFTVQYADGAVPECKGAWAECNSKTALEFSAAAFFFGKEVYKSQKIPIGLISSAVSGSVIDTWMDREALEKIPEGQDIVANYEKAASAAAEKKKSNDAELEKRKKMDPEEVKKLPPLQQPPYVAQLFSRYFKGMVKPVMPFAIKGVIWYQGESNAMFAQGEPYRRMLGGLITDWRTQWGQGEFPFLIVQLQNYGKSNGCWPDLRDSQVYVTKNLPKTSMAVAIDIGDTENIHPDNKEELGRRLGLVARHDVYGEKIVSSGPTYKAMKIEDNGKITLEFDNAGSGLVSKDGAELKCFSIAGEDKRFQAAKAELQDGKLRVWADNVKKPVAVRYAWADNPLGCNLYNKEGLPAAPFRTDEWRLQTQRDRK